MLKLLRSNHRSVISDRSASRQLPQRPHHYVPRWVREPDRIESPVRSSYRASTARTAARIRAERRSGPWSGLDGRQRQIVPNHVGPERARGLGLIP